MSQDKTMQDVAMQDVAMVLDPETVIRTKQRILITGCSGKLGRILWERLEKDNILVGMSRSINRLDIRDSRNIETAIRLHGGVDQIYHLASKVSFNHRDEKEVWDTNVKGTENLLNIARRHKITKVVVVSSACTVGACNNPYTSKNETGEERDQSNAYVKSKLYQEILARRYGAVIVAPSTCGLPLMAGRIIPSGGTNVVDPHDAVEGMIYAMRHGRRGVKYILGGYNVTFEEIYRMAGRKFIVCPRWLRRPLMWAAKFDPSWYMSPYTMDQAFRFKYYNCKKAKEELGWEPIIKLESMLGQR